MSGGKTYGNSNIFNSILVSSTLNSSATSSNQSLNLNEDYQPLPSSNVRVRLNEADLNTFLAPLAREISNFFLAYNIEMADQYGLELLRWGLCSSDVDRAALALKCYENNLTGLTPELIGIIARTCWIFCESAYYLSRKGKDVSSYTNYVKSALSLFLAIAQVQYEEGWIASDSAIFWMAIECLRCNTAPFIPIFTQALHLLIFYLSIPNLFAYVSGQSELTFL